MCVDRDQIIDVVFAGYATKVESLVGHISARLENPNLGPLPSTTAQPPTQALDQLGYKRGSDGIRVVPATTGKYAQPAHPMQYEILTPTSTDFNVDREFEIVKTGFAKLGVKVTQKVGGDTTATYALETGDCSMPRKQAVHGLRHRHVGLGRATSTRTSCSPSSPRASGARGAIPAVNNPEYDKLYKQQGMTVDHGQAHSRSSTRCRRSSTTTSTTRSSSNEQPIDAHAKRWTDFNPELNGYSKLYYTLPDRRDRMIEHRRGAGER